jgi:hypothetical protein
MQYSRKEVHATEVHTTRTGAINLRKLTTAAAIVTTIVLLMATMAFGQSSTTFTQTVNKATLTNGTNFVLTSSKNPSTWGDNVTFTATLSAVGGGSTPSGTIQFQDAASNLGSAVALSSGVATYATSTLSAGTHVITAVYSGDTNYNGSTSSNLSQVVNKAVITITATNATKIYGAALPSFTYTTSGWQNGDTSALITGTPSLTTACTAASHVSASPCTITAAVGTLNALSNYTYSYVNGQMTITPAALTITADNKARAYGVANPALTFTPTGLVNGDTTAAFTTQPTMSTTAVLLSAVGTYPITASGAVDGDYSISYVAGTLTVGKNDPGVLGGIVLTSSLNPSTYGANVTFTATLHNTATGTITFKDSGTTIGTCTLASGTCNMSTTTLAVATHPITFSYSGDANFTAGTSNTVNQVVNKGGVTILVNSDKNPATYGDLVTFTGTVTGYNGIAPTGSVTFTDSLGWTSQMATLTPGAGATSSFTLSTSTLPAGTNVLTITYGGDTNYQIKFVTKPVGGTPVKK